MLFNRAQTPAAYRQAPSQTSIFAGPTRGWVRNESLAASIPQAAERLDNFFPTTEGARMRAGTVKHATISNAAVQLMVYDTGAAQKLFAADAGAIYDVTTPADPDVAPTPDVSGLNAGNWAYTQFANTSGEYLIAVNGNDSEWLYDGSDWWGIDDSDIKILPYDNEVTGFTAGETVTGGTSGDTATIFLVEDNGTDGNLYVKDATGDFQNDETITSAGGEALVDTASPLATKYTGISGVASSALSHVWAFKKKLWFIEDGTLSAWYLGNLAIGGTATEFPLTGVFKKGGNLLFGATWSQDAGDGLDDYCVFVTDLGEVAVYQGEVSSTFSLVGVYQIGKPLDKNAHFRAGGDIAVVCDDGIIPLSSAVSKTGAALSGDAITYPIEDEWREIIRDREGVGTFSVALWHNKTALMVGIPTGSGQDDIMLVANSRTGAWCRYTGWPATCMAVFQGAFYYGTAAGAIIQGESGGDDLDASYSAVWVPRFETWNSPAEKTALHARIMARLENDITPQLFANSDYTVAVPTPLPADAEITTNTWGSGVWGTSTWGASRSYSTLSEWQAVAAVGQALAPGLQITSGRAVAPDVEIVALHLQFDIGQVMG